MDIPRYRIGNDLTVLWAICNNDGTPFDLSGKGVRLFVTNERGMTEVVPTITTDKNGSTTNVILWTFLGNNQKVLGKHTLTVEIVTADDKRVIKRDISDAFNLVARSEGEESGGEANAVDSGTIYLSTKLDVYRFGNARVEIGTNGNWFIDGYDTGRTALAGEPGIVHNIYTESDLGKEFDPDSKIDTFNAHAINAINNALKRMTLKQLQDLSLADLEEYDVLAYNGNAWLNVPFKDLLNIFKGPSESSSGIGDGFWYLNEQDEKIHTDIGIVVHGDAIVEGDTSSGGSGEDVVVGIQGVRVNGTTHYDDDGDGVVDLGTIESGGGGLTSVSWGDIQGTPPSVSTFNNDVPYVTDEELKPLGEEIELLSSMWHLDENGNLVTDKQVIIKNSLISEDDTSSGGEGQDTPGGSGGVSEEDVLNILEKNNYITSSALSSYYTKSESDARYLALSGGTLLGGLQIGSDNNTSYLDIGVKRNNVYTYMATTGAGEGFIGVTFANGNYAGITIIDSLDTLYYNHNGVYKNIIHSGNVGSYALPIGGGNLTGRLVAQAGISSWQGADLFSSERLALNLNSSNAYGVYASFQQSDVTKFMVGYSPILSAAWFENANGYGFYLSDNGNVGIGTTSPLSKLQVDGQINLSAGTNNNYSYIKSENYSFNTARLIIGTCYGYNAEVNAVAIYNGNVGIGTTDLYGANKLRLVNTHPHQHTWSLGYLAQESDLSVEFKDTGGGGVYGLYTSINYYTGYVAMQVGRSDGLTNAYGLILQPLGGNVLIGTAIDSGYKLDVNGQVRAEYYNLHNGAYITQQFGFLCLQSVANELCIGANGYNDIHINYRPSADGTAPQTYYWRAGSATSWSDHYVGDLYAQRSVQTYEIYLREADEVVSPLSMFGMYMWDNIVQFTRRDLNNVYQKSLFELNLNNDNAYIYGNLIVSGDIASA